MRRRPLARSSYHWHPEAKGPSLRYEIILDGAVRAYKDSAGNVVREVCQDSPKGWLEYQRRVGVMVQRQNYRCCLCGRRLSVGNATFEHQRRRGMGAAFRNDDPGVNGAAHWICNSEKG